MIRDTKTVRLFRTGDEQYKTIWYFEHNPTCDICEEPFNTHEAIFIVDWAKKAGRIDNLIHDTCINKYSKHPLSVTQYRWNVLLTDVIPPKSIPVFIQNPSFSPSRKDITVFDDDKLHSDRTNDNAWRSKSYPSLEGAVIGKSLEQLEAEREKEPLMLLEAESKRLLK